MSEDHDDSQMRGKGVGKAAAQTHMKRDQYKRPLDAWKLKKRARPVLSMNFAVTPSPASTSSQQLRSEEKGHSSDDGPPRGVREADKSMLQQQRRQQQQQQQQQQQRSADDETAERTVRNGTRIQESNGSESEDSDDVPKHRRETSFKSTRKVFSPRTPAELQPTSAKRKPTSSQRKRRVQTKLDVNSSSKVARSTRKKHNSDLESIPREDLRASHSSVGSWMQNSAQRSQRKPSESETSDSGDKMSTQRASQSAFSSMRTDNESLGNVNRTVENSEAANESKARNSSRRENITSLQTTDTQATINTQTSIAETASQPTRKRVKRSEVTLPQETLDVFERRRQNVTQNYSKMSQSHVAGHVAVDRSRDPEEAERRREYLRQKRALRERAPEVTTPGAPTSQEETEGAKANVYKPADTPQTMQDVCLLRVEDFKRRKQLGQITDLDVSHSLLMAMAKEHEIEEEDFQYFKSFVKTAEQELAKSVGAALEFKRRKMELNRSRKTAEDLCKTLMALYDKRHKLRVECEARRNAESLADARE